MKNVLVNIVSKFGGRKKILVSLAALIGGAVIEDITKQFELETTTKLATDIARKVFAEEMAKIKDVES